MKKRNGARQTMGLPELKSLLQQRYGVVVAKTSLASTALPPQKREGELFARSVGSVTPLPKGHRAQLHRPDAVFRQHGHTKGTIARDAISDDFEAASLLQTDDVLSFHRSNIGAEVPRKLHRGVWAIQAQLDLHGLFRDEARQRLASFVHDAVKQGFRCVRVVHGKGYGSSGKEPVLKRKVPAWLIQISAVVAFTQAPVSQGGTGALLVLLRRQAPSMKVSGRSGFV